MCGIIGGCGKECRAFFTKMKNERNKFTMKNKQIIEIIEELKQKL
jgi:hypothetical protein